MSDGNDADDKPSGEMRDERDDKESKVTEHREPSSKVRKAEEERRNLKWVSFTRGKLSFGFQHLSPAYIPAMVDDPHGITICLEKVSGWKIPNAVLKEFGKGDYEITAQLSLSMFHLSSSTFFGTTWMGPPVSLGHGDSELPKLIDFEYVDIIYMLSRITDPTCVAILEIVVSKFDLRKKLTVSQYGCGWTILNIFIKPPPADIAEGHQNVDVTSCAMFTGSPRDLIINTDMKTLASRLKEIPDCSLYFKLFSHRRLLKARDLIAENETLGRFDTVAGLVPRTVIPPGATRPRDVSCIGDEEHFDDHDGVFCLPATPRIATGMKLKMSSVQIYMPNRREMEVKMIESYAQMLGLKDTTNVQVISRTLRVGLHNGNTTLGGDWQSHRLDEVKDDNDVLITEAKVLTVDGYVPDVYMALAFLVEYELGTPGNKNTHFNSQTIMKSTRWLNGRMVTAFTVGCAIFIPFDGKKVLLRNTGIRDPGEDGVDLVLQLLKDEACRILTAKPLLLTNLGQAEKAGAAEEAQPKGRLTLKAGDKNDQPDPETTAGGANAQLLLEEDQDSAQVGFDMKMIHPTHGEVYHNENMAEILELDKLKRSRNEESEADARRRKDLDRLRDEDEVDAKGGDDDDLIDATGRSRSFRSRGFGVTRRSEEGLDATANKTRDSFTMRSEFTRDRDFDDAQSVAESIVTGDSEHSSLRLDAMYYTSAGRTRDPRSHRSGGGGGGDLRGSGIGWDGMSEQSSDAGGRMRGMSMRDTRFSVPRDRTSLLAQSLQTKLVAGDHTGRGLLHSAAEILPSTRAQGGGGGHRMSADHAGGSTQVAPKTIVGINTNAAHIRELSRGARSRLNRHGFDGAIIDSSLDAVMGRPHTAGGAAPTSGKNVVVDIDLEARDDLSLHEINIQFAGYRAGARQSKADKGGAVTVVETDHYIPKAVYFSFQFYSCMPTRTEVMRLLQAEPGQLAVLTRDQAYARDETPLTLRFLIDCSTASPNEAFEFAEYLAHGALYVDVWDADSLLHLGTCGVPLRRLMRQGQVMSKQAIECDVINAELGASHAQGGISSSVVAEGGPMSGTIVGAVQIILANTGQRGRGPSMRQRLAAQAQEHGDVNSPAAAPSMNRYYDGDENDDLLPLEGLNWRAYGVARDVGGSGGGGGRSNKLFNRPKNSVRAKPLSESSPELQKALTDVRHSMDHQRLGGGGGGGGGGGPSLRSLTAQRGGSGVCTLTYDEVAIIFRRFKGVMKGTVQYSGDLLSLLDMPSLSTAIKKLIQAYKKFGDHDGLMREILRHCNAASELTMKDLEEFFRVIFDKTGLKCRPEELTLLAQRFISNGSGQFVSAQQVIEFCAEEADRHEWTLVGSRFRLAAQRATLEGADVEQLLSEQDAAGTHYINASRFKDFLRAVNKFGNLSPKDINLCCRHFSRRGRSPEEDKDPVSLREVMAFLGVEYVGNLQVRIRKVIAETERGCPDVKEMLQILNTAGGTVRTKEQGLTYVYEEVEAAFSMVGVYKEVSHDQVRAVLKKLDTKASGRLSAAQILTYLGIAFKAADLSDNTSQSAAVEEEVPLDAEGLIRMLLEKVQSNGVAVDEAFRHFDKNGDGSITKHELIEGLTKLRIFDNTPNWKKQMPPLLKKFDKNGDGEVSLRELFHFLGIKEYAPDIIQRMTKIFAAAAQKKVSVKDIFEHLDKDNSGQLDAEEIEEGLKALGSFGEVTREDAEAVVSHFDDDGDKQVSIDEFVTFFTERVQVAIKERRKRRLDRVAATLRKTFSSAVSKGSATLRDIFDHLDKDKGGSVDTKELIDSIKKLPSFKRMTENDWVDLMAVLDEDGSGEISFDEFESFVMGGDEGSTLDDSMSVGTLGTSMGASAPATLIDRLRDMFKAAQAKGLTFAQAFLFLDKDGSGELSVDELYSTLQKLPNFKEVPFREVKELFDLMDADNSGQVSVDEFHSFVQDGKMVSEFRREKHLRDRREMESMDVTKAKEVFIRHMRRISQIDGSVSGLLAYLDDDEDGLIAYSTFKALLRREDVFETITEEIVESLIDPLMQDHTHIRAAALLRFIEGNRVGAAGTAGGGGGEGKHDDEDEENAMLQRPYDFSPNPEIRALEKKVRGFGRILAKQGVDVESLFQYFDAQSTGCVRRTELLEVLSKLGMYILEQGRVLDEAVSADKDVHRLQMHQVNRLKGKGGAYVQNAPRMARRLLMNGGAAVDGGDFKDHLESMTLVNWYRQSQKQLLLQRVLSHSLAHTIRIYPRFGKTQFFEFPTTNPFAHEERFQIEINDPELKLVTMFDEWLHLRRVCRPAVGQLGNEPVEAEMFDRDGTGNVQVALLPHETLYIPFTFMTLSPFTPESRLTARDAPRRRGGGGSGGGGRYGDDEEGKGGEESKSAGRGGGESKNNGSGGDAANSILRNEEPHRTVEVKVVSCTHGHIICILKVLVCPRPYVVNRVLRFQEAENSIMKRRVQIVGHENLSAYPGEYTNASKYVHCVEGGVPTPGTAATAAAAAAANNDSISPPGAAGGEGGAGGAVQSRVVVEWGPANEHFRGQGALDLLIRYRCGPFPHTGNFYLLIYNDPYQCDLHEIWQVIVQTRQRLDIHGSVGSIAQADLVVRGDRFARRARAYALPSPADIVSFRPDNVFQLVPGAYNRVALSISPKCVGYRQVQLNLVDEDSRELISSWLLAVSATSPAVMRSYDVDIPVGGGAVHKKIVFKNPWDVPRKFALSSSDPALMRPRTSTVEVTPLGTSYLRLLFSGIESGGGGLTREVHLFLNDANGGQNEECYLFRIRDV